MDVPIRAAGIPALARVTWYQPAFPGNVWEPPTPAEVEFDLCDRRGRPAPWLAEKLTERDWHDIECDVLDFYDNISEATT